MFPVKRSGVFTKKVLQAKYSRQYVFKFNKRRHAMFAALKVDLFVREGPLVTVSVRQCLFLRGLYRIYCDI